MIGLVFDDAWRARLVSLGGAIHQDDGPDLDEVADAEQRAADGEYLHMLDALANDEDALADASLAETVLESLHPIDDYGLYESTYAVVQRFRPDALTAAAVRVLPGWLRRNGPHHSIRTALRPIVGDGPRSGLVGGVADWDAADRAVVRDAAASWAREDAAWQSLAEALGARTPRPAVSPVPEEWPDDWRAAATAFRETGSVRLAWTDERNIPGNFDRVFALLELEHGARWREVPDFLNTVLVRRKREIPGFVAALAALPAARRDVILDHVRRARPDLGTWLEDEVRASRVGSPPVG